MSILKKFLLSAMCALTLAGSTATAGTPEPSRLTVKSRTGTSTRAVVSYAIDGRSLTMIAEATRVEVYEGSRLLLRAVDPPIGEPYFINHRGQRFTATQLQKTTSLIAEFDPAATAALDPDVAFHLVTGESDDPYLNPVGCGATIPLFVACAVGAWFVLCVDWGCSTETGCWAEHTCGNGNGGGQPD